MSKSKAPFSKFIQQKESGAKKKERIRQEKKTARKETQAYFEQKKAEARAMRAQRSEARGQRPEEKPETSGKRPVNKGYNRMSYLERKKKQAEKALHTATGTQKPEATNRKPAARSKQPATRPSKPATPTPKHTTPNPQSGPRTPEYKTRTTKSTPDKPIPLNKFIAHSGVASRRDAAEIVKSGIVVVNGQVVTEPGFKVSKQDAVKVNGKPIQIRQTMVYILLNKPKDYITTTEDPQGRKTVLDLIRNATTERVYPIGRLDRNTTGVLLLTNDGELAQKLAHPSYMVKKIYEVKLDKPLTKKDFETILNGVTLEDGFIAPDALAYADSKDKSVIGIEIHSGRNRIVRRIFEHLGYDVRNLDRVMYASLTKKNVERGKWRFLNEKEVRLLKYLNTSYTKNKSTARG